MKIVPRRTFALIGGDGSVLEIGARHLLPKAKPCEAVCAVLIVAPDDTRRSVAAAEFMAGLSDRHELSAYHLARTREIFEAGFSAALG